MRRTKRIIAIIMIFLSMLLQISYASTTSKQSIADTGKYRIHFSSIEYEINENYKYVDLIIDNGDGANIGVSVNNIYPGVMYNIKAVIENSGSDSAKLTSLRIEAYDEDNSDGQGLYDMLVGGIDETKKVRLNDYVKYLDSLYTNKVVNSGESFSLNLSMGMDENITDLENVSCSYKIIVDFEQYTHIDEDQQNEDEDKDYNKDNEEKKHNNPVNNDNINENTNEDMHKLEDGKSSIPLEDEKPVFTTNSSKALPNTGETSPILVYGLGLALMLGGIFLLRKNNVAE